MAAGGHFGCPKITFGRISGYFRPICNLHFFLKFWITFLVILDQCIFFIFFLQNGCRWPYWMFENHFRPHFYPFHIDTQLSIFDKMADVGIFGCPKFTFDRISGHFRSIRNLNFADVGHFGCPKFTFDHNSGHFRSIQIFFSGGHFGYLKIILDRISGHFRTIGHFGFPKFTFNRNSGHFRSIQKFFFRRPCWMSENHFGSHFWPFQIDRPFWMSEINFRWHFWPFQIHTEL